MPTSHGVGVGGSAGPSGPAGCCGGVGDARGTLALPGSTFGRLDGHVDGEDGWRQRPFAALFRNPLPSWGRPGSRLAWGCSGGWRSWGKTPEVPPPAGWSLPGPGGTCPADASVQWPVLPSSAQRPCPAPSCSSGHPHCHPPPHQPPCQNCPPPLASPQSSGSSMAVPAPGRGRKRRGCKCPQEGCNGDLGAGATS